MVSRPTFEGFTSNGFENSLPPATPQLCKNPPCPEFAPGHGKERPASDLVYDSIATRTRHPDSSYMSNLDPETIAKLKDTILTDVTKTSKTQVAYNDIGAYRPDRLRPFNDTATQISLAQMENGNFLNDEFTDNYYDLWLVQRDKERDKILDVAHDVMESNLMCTDYDHANQCMSVCSNTNNCMGFYIDSPGKCCMMVQPPFDDYRDRWNIPPNNTFPYAFRTLNNLINYEELARDKVVFQKLKAEDGNDVYQVPMDRQNCRAMCPKCIMGRCPLNYRCVNMTADPRFNYSCIITNEGRYNEKTGHTFDNSSIPYLDDKYALNEYAGYDSQLKEPDLAFPRSQKFDLTEGIIPSGRELQKIWKNWDQNHVGPHTYRNCTLDDMSLLKKKCTAHDMVQNYEQQCGTDGKTKCHKNKSGPEPIVSQSADKADRSISSVVYGPEGFDQDIEPRSFSQSKKGMPVPQSSSPAVEHFDAWINRKDCFNPNKESEDANFVAIRGGNDPISLTSYIDYTPRFVETENRDWVTAKMVIPDRERFVPTVSQRYLAFSDN